MAAGDYQQTENDAAPAQMHSAGDHIDRQTSGLTVTGLLHKRPLTQWKFSVAL
jgi:hypothetical protein